MQSLFPPDPWHIIREDLKQHMSPHSYQAWLEPIDSYEVTEQEIIITVPNMVFYHGILTECMDAIEQAKGRLGIGLCVRFEITEGSESDDEEEAIQAEGLDESELNLDTAKNSRIFSNETNLNVNFTFDSFVSGPSNQFALASSKNVADSPGRNYNPLFIYGSTGLGKTHLLHAIGNFIQQQNPDKQVNVISSERFMNEMIYCLRFHKMRDFRRKYRNSDVFLCDDIQFISGKKKATQEEFFHTFNTLYEAKKQIVLTSDLFPKDIPDIEDRLRNRFQWGLISDIQPPDVEHRTAILLSKAEQLRLNIDSEVANFIAQHATRNIRELEGALHRIKAFAAFQGRPIDLQLASETFQGVIPEKAENITIEQIQQTVAKHFKLRVTDLKSKNRKRAFTLPRQVAMFLVRKFVGCSFPEIGEAFGGKDHTTVLHAYKKIDRDRKRDLDLRAHLETLERSLEHNQ